MESNASEIADDEILIRHVPGGTTWIAPGPRLTSANFRPREVLGETALSVNRLSTMTPDELSKRMKGSRERGSRVIWATAGAIRSLGLLVRPDPLENDPGHALIDSGPDISLNDRNTQRALGALFQFEESLPNQSR